MAQALTASTLRLDHEGRPAVDGLTFATTGQHVLLLGAPRVVFSAAAGLEAPARGTMCVQGVAPRLAVRTGLAASAFLDPPLPPRWTPRLLATWSARLVGHGRSVARELAVDSLRRLDLTHLADTPDRTASNCCKARLGAVRCHRHGSHDSARRVVVNRRRGSPSARPRSGLCEGNG